MRYELAKKLKDAGFPYKKSLFGGLTEESYLDEKGNTYNQPTLSELIEACGDSFGSLGVNGQGINNKKWHCFGKNRLIEFGKTPEEAVANLWLELNKK